jgi:hypothetical protein
MRFIFILMATTFLLAGCGKKPNVLMTPAAATAQGIENKPNAN